MKRRLVYIKWCKSREWSSIALGHSLVISSFHSKRGDTLYERNRYDEASVSFEQAIRLDRQNAGIKDVHSSDSTAR
jgi:TPR repeat